MSGRDNLPTGLTLEEKLALKKAGQKIPQNSAGRMTLEQKLALKKGRSNSQKLIAVRSLIKVHIGESIPSSDVHSLTQAFSDFDSEALEVAAGVDPRILGIIFHYRQKRLNGVTDDSASNLAGDELTG